MGPYALTLRNIKSCHVGELTATAARVNIHSLSEPSNARNAHVVHKWGSGVSCD
jgi:hypothetical protein